MNNFPSYKHSGAQDDGTPYYDPFPTSTGCCNSCADDTCASNLVASYDGDGHILVPSGNIHTDPDMVMNWQNSSPPDKVHTVSCGHQVSIQGIVSLSNNESWCSSAENLNGIYHMLYPNKFGYTAYNFLTPEYEGGDWVFAPAGGTCRNDDGYFWYEHMEYLGTIGFCNKNSPISTCGFDKADFYLMIGTDGEYDPWYKAWNPAAVFPDGGDYQTRDRIYRNKDREAESRPQLYLYAIAHFHPPRYAWAEDAYWFKTKIAEWNGDYYEVNYSSSIGFNMSDMLAPFSDTKTLVTTGDYGGQYTKVYHGDFDGRNMSFTINGSDRMDTNETITYGDVCYFDQMTISITPYEDDSQYTQVADDPYRGFLNSAFSSKDMIDDKWTEYYSHYQIHASGVPCNKWLTAYDYDADGIDGNLEDVIPELAYVTIAGVTSVNADEDDKYACNNVDVLNDKHVMIIQCQSSDENQTPSWFNKLSESVCCQCDSENSPCVVALWLLMDAHWVYGQTSQFNTLKLYVLKGDVSYDTSDSYYPSYYDEMIAVYEKDLYNANYPNGFSADDLNNMTLDIAWINPDYEDQISFVGSTAIVTMTDKVESCDCLPLRDCGNCREGTAEVDIQVTVEGARYESSSPTTTCPDGSFWDGEFVLGLGSYIYGSTIYWNNSFGNCSWYHTLEDSSQYTRYHYVVNMQTFTDPYEYQLANTSIIFENETILWFSAITQNLPGCAGCLGSAVASYWYKSYPINTIDGRGAWIDCDFNDVNMTYLGHYGYSSSCHVNADSVIISMPQDTI